MKTLHVIDSDSMQGCLFFKHLHFEHRIIICKTILISHDPEKLALLETYYTSGQWRDDYEADERGELPPDLKRGVLSQDGLYDLLERSRSP